MSDQDKPAPEIDIDAVMAKYEARQRRARALLTDNKATLFAALAAAGVTGVTVSFDGYGDSGQIENVQLKGVASLPDAIIVFLCAPWQSEEPERRPLTLAAAIEQLAYDCLSQQHDGWENNEGAFGEFTFDIEAATIVLDFNYRIESTENHTHQF